MAEKFAPLVLFDLDGTLLDSARDLHAAMNLLLLEKSEPLIAFDDFRPIVSKGSRAMLKQSFLNASDAARELLIPEFLALYEQGLAQHSRIFDGINEVLGHIEQQGAVWGIVTNKPFYLAEPLVQKLGWMQRSKVLLGGDSLPKRKPEPDQLLHACRMLSIDPEKTVYIGDDQRDVQAANAANMRSVGALWGYRPHDDQPADWQADDLAGQPLDLIEQRLMYSLT